MLDWLPDWQLLAVIGIFWVSLSCLVLAALALLAPSLDAFDPQPDLDAPYWSPQDAEWLGDVVHAYMPRDGMPSA